MMKYLICEDFAGHPSLFVFPRRVDHADMREQLPYRKIISAGYVEMHDGHFHCTGGSAELEVAARPEDAEILAKAFSPDNVE